MVWGDLSWTVPDFWDLWKAIAVALTGVFGVLGLLTNYKDKETGRITVWGKVNLVGIVLSATMGVLSQLIDAQHKIDSARQSAIEAAASAKLAATTAQGAQTAAANTERLIGQLLQVSHQTARIAQGTERSVANSRDAALAGQAAAARTLVVARGTAEAVTASKAGLVRVERLLSPFEEPNVTLMSFNADAGMCAAAPGPIDVTLMISRPQPAVTSVAKAIKGDSTSTSYHGAGKIIANHDASGRCGYELTAKLAAFGNDLEHFHDDR